MYIQINVTDMTTYA